MIPPAIAQFWSSGDVTEGVLEDAMKEEIVENVESKEMALLSSTEIVSWADAAEEEEEEIKLSIQRANEERGRKIFIGNIVNQEGSPTLITFALLAAILSKYGPIESIRYHLTRKYAFFVFEKRENALIVMKDLKNYKVRCSWVNTISKHIQSSNDSLVPNIPQPAFYCRWPKDSRPRAKKQNKNRKKRKTRNTTNCKTNEAPPDSM